ncbi:MAG: hypothetical protein ACLFTH_01005 [Candidatus Woesearchaeota archaeon]
MKDSFALSYKGRTWRRPIYEPDETVRYELIEVDGVPDDMDMMIRDIFSDTIFRLTEYATRRDYSRAADDCSLALYQNLPFNLFRSAQEFDENFREENETLFYDSYLFSNPNKNPHKLTDLCVEDALNCVGHSLLIKEVLASEKWGIFALYSENQIGSHHTVARAYDEFIIRIDPVAGSRKTIQGMDPEQVYLFDKNAFCKRYTPTPYME